MTPAFKNIYQYSIYHPLLALLFIQFNNLYSFVDLCVLFRHVRDSLTSAWPDPGAASGCPSVRGGADPGSTRPLPLFQCRAGRTTSARGGQSPEWHWEEEGRWSGSRRVKLLGSCISKTVETGSHVPAALNARSSWEAVAAHFLKTDHVLSLNPSHFPGSRGHQLPKVNCVVIQQWQQTTLSQSKQVISQSVWQPLSSFFSIFFHSENTGTELTCPGRKWICVTAVVSLCSPVNSTPGSP